MKSYDYLIVGAGYAGSVCARQLADAGNKVLVLDKRRHIGGNAYDEKDSHGVLIHPYGPHIFHTNSKKVFEYLSRFTTWRFYEHRVLAKVLDQYYPIPINRLTVNKVFGLNLSEDEVEAFLEKKRIPKESVRTSEDVVLNSVGPELCEMFFRGYTKKQWDLDLSELSAGVAARIPTRTNDDDRYFTDTDQFTRADGYTAMCERILDSPNIDLELNVDFLADKARWVYDKLIYTGPVDAFYEYCYGQLPYRSLSFEHQHLADADSVQAVGTVNYPNEESFTRITEFKRLTGQEISGTSIVREYSKADGDPYYPVPNPNNEALYKKYQNRADTESNIYFVGRLAQYRYYNMDQVVAAALSLTEKLIS